jgi:nucleoside-diphosphate-sugar epimerase
LLQTREPAEVPLPYIGNERLLLVHVDDIARAILALLEAPHAAHAIYNAPCESWVVSDLKQELESLNPHLRVALGDAHAQGNPRLLDSSRFCMEFRFKMLPLGEWLRTAAGH